MAKRKATANAKKTDDNGKNAKTSGESTMGYFRRILKENPRLLKARSNDEILNRWLKDHPGETEVPKKVKQSLSNTKSVLRSKRRRRGVEKAPGSEGKQLNETTPHLQDADLALEHLEESIDECLMLAKGINREGLGNVISLLRRARNEIVWKLGE